VSVFDLSFVLYFPEFTDVIGTLIVLMCREECTHSLTSCFVLFV